MASSSRPASRYGERRDPGYRRLALAPGLLAAVALLVGAAALGEDVFTVVRYIVTILAAIVAVFAYQGKAWGWIPAFAAIAVAWNPIWPIAIPDPWWQGMQYVAVVVFLLAGWFITVAIPEEQRR